MYAKSISYVDYDGNERTETYFFNLNKAELIEMNVSEKGGLEKTLQRMIDEQDSRRLFEMFKFIILKSVGVKSTDGKRFVKSKEIAEAFEQTEAYSEMVVEFFKDADKAAEFINGIMPADLSEAAAKMEGSVVVPMV